MRSLPVIVVLGLVAGTLLSGCLAADRGPAPADDPDPAGDERPVPAHLVPTAVEGGATFADATALEPSGLYRANLTEGQHYFKFHTEAGDSINIELRETLAQGSLPASDNMLRFSFRLLSPDGAILETPHSNQGDTRMLVPAAPVTGEYRFHVTEEIGGFTGEYTFCFLRPPQEEHPCPDIGMRPQEITMGGVLADAARTTVLLLPPAHGDLGNPAGPTALDYLDAALSGIHEWVRVLHEFADDHPEYDYLKEITVEVAVFDGTQVMTEFDIVIGYIATGGTQFRGFATPCLDPPRCIMLSLYSQSPRAGQTTPDYPTYDDMEAVTKHEFAHVWGLGHTLTWTDTYGPDLMNSPAPFVYGDGNGIGDGGVESKKICISTLNLYGMALLFQHLDGKPQVTEGEYALPEHIPYEWYC